VISLVYSSPHVRINEHSLRLVDVDVDAALEALEARRSMQSFSFEQKIINLFFEGLRMNETALSN
jgi:hypothetical protein